MKIIADTNIPFVQECFSSIGEVSLVGGRDITKEIVADADILLVRSVTKVNKQLLQGSNVKFVATATIGVDHIDTKYLKQQGIGFASAPGSNANSVAEYVVAGLLDIANEKDIALEGKSIGVIGVGNVGSIVAKKVKALGMKVVLNDPPLQRLAGDQKYQSIEKVYDCDFVTVHTPLTFDGIDKTYHLADKVFFDSLKNGGIFLNTSRGAVVDGGALKDAVKNNKFKAVALDVWEAEPDIDIKLLDMVDIATPHIAGYSYDGKVCGMVMIYESACEFFGFEPEFSSESFLPVPEVATLEVDGSFDLDIEVLHSVVKKIYDIKADDDNLRQLLNKAEADRGGWFSGLRKNYHIRREFQNTQLSFSGKGGDIKNKFAGIGFKIIPLKGSKCPRI
ncbi:MAG: 4-phosphoerythronate dehydrogenase, partial [Planctomycetes bacterium]|nr:4-phosphoerythronate dehydrogenase [Planctomycetota bacterium]